MTHIHGSVYWSVTKKIERDFIMDNLIEVEQRNNYGQEYLYPINAQGKRLAKLLNQKTFTDRTVSQAQDLGFIFELVVTSNLGKGTRWPNIKEFRFPLQ